MSTPHPHQVIVLDADQADDLAHLLDRVTDWLHHAGDEARHDLAEFFNRPGNGRLAAAGLIAVLGAHTAALRHHLKQVVR